MSPRVEPVALNAGADRAWLCDVDVLGFEPLAETGKGMILGAQ